ncbi:MAG: hypothetical protein F6K58_28790 [Symploca sp. SIO2E9]|nr:hypothetical protein [Symploca sp. SIO2E9]
MDFNEKSQFQFLYEGLADKYPGIKSADGVTSNFQFMQTPLFANWTSGDDAQAYDIANSRFLDLGGFFVRGEGFAQSYRDLIQSIAPNTGDSNQEYKDDIARLSKNNKLKQSIIDHARTQYAAYLRLGLILKSESS